MRGALRGGGADGSGLEPPAVSLSADGGGGRGVTVRGRVMYSRRRPRPSARHRRPPLPERLSHVRHSRVTARRHSRVTAASRSRHSQAALWFRPARNSCGHGGTLQGDGSPVSLPGRRTGEVRRHTSGSLGPPSHCSGGTLYSASRVAEAALKEATKRLEGHS